MEDGMQGELTTQLRELNERIARQNSFWHMFLVGILYGVGFFIGSAILATIALGIFGPLLAHIPLVQSAFQRGSSFEQQH